MKNIRNILYAVAAITFAACSSNENDGLGEPSIPLTIEASVAEANTRAAVNGFTASSTIGVSLGDLKNVEFVTSEGSTTKFVPAADAATIYLEQSKEAVTAYAPYSADDKISLDASNQDALTDVLYAEGTANIATGRANLIFQHRLSKITFVVSLGDGYADTDALDATALSDVKFSGLITDGSYTPSTDGLILNAATANVPLTQSDTDDSGCAIFSAIVLPQSASTIELSMAYNQKDYSGTFATEGLKLERGNNYVYKVKINKTKLTISGSSSVDKWGTSDPVSGEFNYTRIGNVTEPSQVVIGDYVLNDGSFIHLSDGGKTTLTDAEMQEVAGVVFWLGDAYTSGDSALPEKYSHGLIVGLDEVSTPIGINDDNYYNIGDSHITSDTKMGGYTNTQIHRVCNANLQMEYYSYVTKVDAYNATKKIAGDVSDWYAPGMCELLTLYHCSKLDYFPEQFVYFTVSDADGLNAMNAAIEAAGGTTFNIYNSYWTNASSVYGNMYLAYPTSSGICLDCTYTVNETRTLRYICAF
jgi:hypothetical protein